MKQANLIQKANEIRENQRESGTVTHFKKYIILEIRHVSRILKKYF